MAIKIKSNLYNKFLKWAQYDNDLGFTLVELMVVISVVGIMAALIIPQFIPLEDKARKANALNLVRDIASAAAMVYNQSGVIYPTTNDMRTYLTNIDSIVTNSNEKGKYKMNYNGNEVIITSVDEPVVYASAYFR